MSQLPHSEMIENSNLVNSLTYTLSDGLVDRSVYDYNHKGLTYYSHRMSVKDLTHFYELKNSHSVR